MRKSILPLKLFGLASWVISLHLDFLSSCPISYPPNVFRLSTPQTTFNDSPRSRAFGPKGSSAHS